VIVLILTFIRGVQNVYEKCLAYQAALKITAKSKREKTVLKFLKPFGIKYNFLL